MKYGMYLHVPFCKRACHYCDFHFSTVQKRAPVLQAMVREIEMVKQSGIAGLSSIYFGGGTPSILNANEFCELMDAIHKHFTFDSGAEITIEANPDDLSVEILQVWKSAGVNRLSVGIQSFFEKDLMAMNRAHNAQQAREAIPLIRSEGFENFSIDLIYGLPGSTLEDWEANLDLVLHENIPHLSAYALTVEPNTALAHFVKKGLVNPLPDEHYEAQYQILTAKTQNAGMVQYEVSNFCLPGKSAVHNANYWAGVPYLGIGPGAHAFDGVIRGWNVANNTRYAQAILERGERPITLEHLTPYDRYNEYIMTGLRTIHGINPAVIAENFPTPINDEFKLISSRLIGVGKLEESANGNLRIPDQMRFFSDGIASDLFVLKPG
jgi:oxygen-independent coproporphyrinogen III oxidase